MTPIYMVQRSFILLTYKSAQNAVLALGFFVFCPKKKKQLDCSLDNGSLCSVTWKPEQIAGNWAYILPSATQAGSQAEDHSNFITMNTIFFLVQIISSVPLSAILVYVIVKLVSWFRRSRELDGCGYAVLITGCDSGFGHQLARSLDQREFVVFAGCLFPEGSGAQRLARESSSRLKILKLDVTSERDVQQAKKMIQRSLPKKGEGLTLCEQEKV